MNLIIFLGCVLMVLIIIFPPVLLGAAIERDEPGEIGLTLTFVIIEVITLVLVLYMGCKGVI